MLTTTLAAAFTALAYPQEPTPQRLEVVPLRRPGSDAPLPPPFGTLMPWAGDMSLVTERNFVSEGVDNGKEFYESLLGYLHAGEADAGHLHWDDAGDQLQVSGAAPAVTTAYNELLALGAVLRSGIAVDVDLFEALDLADPPVVLAADDPRPTGRGAHLWHGHALAPSGTSTSFDALRWVRYVQGANVEVAQESSISSPSLGAFATGTAVRVAVHALAAADDYAVFVQFAHGQHVRTDSIHTGVSGQPPLDLPRIRSTFGTASARIPAAGAMQVVLLGTPDSGPRVVLTVRARRAAPVPPLPAAQVQVLPISALTTTSLRGRIGLPKGAPRLHDDHSGVRTDGASLPLLTAEHVAEIARAACGTEPASVVTNGDHLLVLGSPKSQQQVREAIGGLENRLLQTTALDVAVHLTELPADGAAAPAAGARRTVVLRRAVLPVLTGREAFVFQGTECTSIRTMLAEIAQQASVTVPFVETLQDGLWLRCMCPAEPAGDAISFGARAEFVTHSQLRNLGSVGAMHLVDIDGLGVPDLELLPPGAPRELAQGNVIERESTRWQPALRVTRTPLSAGR